MWWNVRTFSANFPAMGKTIYLHVGHYKTGTTALQTFLSNNPRWLEKSDLLYCRSSRHLAKHSALAFSLYRAAGVKQLMHGYRKNVPPKEIWTELLDEVRQAPQSRAIVSSEEFMRMGSHSEAARMLAEIAADASDIEFRVIAYLREPEAHLRSWYNQLVKMGIQTPAFNTAAPTVMEAIHFDYALALKPWVDLVGPDRISLRSYSDRHRNGTGLFEDFLLIFDLKLPARGINLPTRDPNPRLDDRIVELTRVLSNAGLQDAAIQRVADRTLRFLQAESANMPAASAKDFDTLRQQSLAGLDALAEMLPADAAQVASLREHLPQREDPGEADGWRLAGLLLSEIALLRKSFAKTTRELDERLKALEGAQNLKRRD